ncbi:MAG: CBS domain-containing protein [Polyangiales bacterium]
MAWTPPQLEALAEKVREEETARVVFRDLLGWFGASRAGARALATIAEALERLDLATDPPLEGTPVEATVTLRRRVVSAPGASGGDGTPTPRLRYAGFRVGALLREGRTLVSVRPDAPVREAITQMLFHDYSQLPVMRTEWDCLGFITWKSIGHENFFSQTTTVRDCLRADFEECGVDDNLFDVLDRIIRHEVVIVRGANRRVQGVLTTTDLAEAFRTLAEPFLLLSEVEGHLRVVLDRVFSPAEMREALPADERDGDVQSAADLSFGSYVRLLQPRAGFDRLAVPHDHGVISRELDLVREIRNRVMHFRPEGLAAADLERLRRFAQLLRDMEARR